MMVQQYLISIDCLFNNYFNKIYESRQLLCSTQLRLVMFESPNSDEGDNKNEKRRIVISPSDIGSLFGSQLNQVNTQSLQEDYDMEEQDSDDKTERFNEVSNNQDNVIIQELKMLERMQTSNAIDQKNINEIESLEDIDDKYDFVDELDLNAVLDKVCY